MSSMWQSWIENSSSTSRGLKIFDQFVPNRFPEWELVAISNPFLGGLSNVCQVSKRARKSRSHSVHKPRGVIHPRVRAVGPEHFAFICVDCAKSRSKLMLADFYGRVLMEPTIIEHDRFAFEAH